MKHSLKITFILVALFFVAQFVGLFTINKYISVDTKDTGEVEVYYPDTAIGEQPQIPEGERNLNFIPIIMAVLVGTVFLFILIRFNLSRVWKFWFFMAITLSLSVAFGVYFDKWWIALMLGAVFSLFRVFKPNVFVHNFTEVFIYPGITILILPWLNLFSAFVLLILISLYDMYAVWRSKHMVKLAKFQLKSKMFAGISMSYKETGSSKSSKKGKKMSNAILGGGDIAFPLLFSAAVMQNLIIYQGISKLSALMLSYIVSTGAGIGLVILFFYSKKNKFYPAMPFITLGCLIGYGIILLI